jgi:hypothetical protein
VGVLRGAIAACLAITIIALVAFGIMAAAADTTTVQEISSDPYTNVSSQHQTEVEPDTFSSGNTVVAAFQAGRFMDAGGSSNIGWATSTDGGTTWAHGFLPSLTVNSTPAGAAGRASDPSVGFDAKHSAWLISSLVCAPAPDTCSTAPISMVVSRSADGINWSAPVVLSTGDYDKNWTACDNSAGSPFFGRCYTSWLDIGSGLTLTSASNDGGVTWGSPVSAAGMVGVQPVVQADGTLIIVGVSGSNVIAVRSANGGASFGSAMLVASIQSHDPSGMRAPVLPSVALDGAGTVYAVWPDCRFRASCSANDIVWSTSADGISWPAAPSRVPIDSTVSGVDHFIPGVAIDPATAGGSANVGIAYYYFPDAACSPGVCELNVGFISSSTGGATWGSPSQLNAQPMALSWLANTTWPGRMVGDYISASFVSGHFVAVFALASAPTGATFHEAMSAAAIGPGPTATPSPAPSPSATPSPTPSPDSDGDGVLDSADNCPQWPNPAQTLPPWSVPVGDPDCDGFSSTRELFVGTNPSLACGSNGWPVDNNDDYRVRLGDVLAYIPVFNSVAPDPPYNARFDLNADGNIALADILTFIPFFNRTCTP